MLDEYNIPGFSLPFNTSFSVRGTLPPLDYLKFPPADLPKTLLPPPDHPTLAHPFTIRSDWYNGMLSANVPITIALIYATVVTYLNSVNHNRKYKPWAFSQTQLFKLLVITHNIFLAIYSGWTFIGMINALAISVVPPTGPHGLAGTVDSLCKINGPRGIGSAAVYDSKTSVWGIANRAFHLGADGLLPESSDVGRIWNEGLAFYGWLFYISKFYEVVDTFIILAKGKKSSLLQTYHHAGAMLCMWAGIRYMSPPIWMFVTINSFIHTIMYTFYFCTAIGIKVPVPLKKTLTTMQITQFVVGAGYAFAHLFIKYQSPISVPYLYHLGDVASAIPSDASSAASFALATASAGPIAWLKKAALRAAGREGLAENIWNEEGKPFGIDAVHAAQDFVRREEIRYRDQLNWVNCLDTSGQVFAILLNCMYLAPLTMLFVQFFVKAYTGRIDRRRRSSASAHAAAVFRSGEDASKGVARQLSEAFEDVQTGVTELGDDEAVIDGEELKKELKSVVDSAKLGTASALSALKDQADQAKAKIQTDFPADLNKLSGKGQEGDGVNKADDRTVEHDADASRDSANRVTEGKQTAQLAATADSHETNLAERESTETEDDQTADRTLVGDEEVKHEATEADPPRHTNADTKVADVDHDVGAKEPNVPSALEDTTADKSAAAAEELPSDSSQLVDDQNSHEDHEMGTDQEASWIHVDADEQHDSSRPDQSVTESTGHQSKESTVGADLSNDQSYANEEAGNGQDPVTASAADADVPEQPEATPRDEKPEHAERVEEDAKEESTAQSATEAFEAETPSASLESKSSDTPKEAEELQPVVPTEQPSESETAVPVKDDDGEEEIATSGNRAQHSLATEVNREETLKSESIETTHEEKTQTHVEDDETREDEAADTKKQEIKEVTSKPDDSSTEKQKANLDVAPATEIKATDAEKEKSKQAISSPDDSAAGKISEDSSATEVATSSNHQSGTASAPAEDERTYAEVVAEEPANSEEPEAEPPATEHTQAVKSEDASEDLSKPAEEENQPGPGDIKGSPSMDEKLSASAEELLPPVENTKGSTETDVHDEKDLKSGGKSSAEADVEPAGLEKEQHAVDNGSDAGTETDSSSTKQNTKQKPKRKPPKLEIRNKTKKNGESTVEDDETKEEPGSAKRDSETPSTESQASKDTGDETAESDQGTPSKDGA